MNGLRKQLRKHNKEWLESTICSVGDAVITIDKHGMIDFINLEASKILERSYDEVLGKKFHEVFVVFEKETFVPMRFFNENAAHEIIDDHLDRGLVRHSVLEVSEGKYKHLSAHFSKMVAYDYSFLGYIVVFRDISRIIMVEKAVEQEKNNLMKMFDLLPLAMIVINDQLLIENANQAFSETFGVNKDFIIGSAIGDALKCVWRLESGCGKGENCLFCNFRNKVTELIIANKTDKGFQVQMSLESIKDVWLSINFMPIEMNDQMKYMITLGDITDRIHYENEMEKTKEMLEDANRAKSEFLANMSHEIRTPLNGIVGMVDLTMMDALTKDQKENLETAKECVNSLIDIINDVLDFSKIEAGKMRLEAESFEVKSLVESIVKSHVVHASKKGLDLTIEYKDMLVPFLMGDAMRIRQVLNNLLSNAIKFTNQGHVKVVVEESEMEDEGSLYLTLSILDTGIGIPLEKQSMLFKSFTQIDGSYTRQYGGTGLGLIITKQLVEMMSGLVYFESYENLGSSFYIRLPLKVSEDPTYQKLSHPSNFKKYKGKSILLVEDDKVNQIVMRKMLEINEFEVMLANNGQEAVEKCSFAKYDLILMDIQMPVMDGVMATKNIRESENFNQFTPIVALTAFALNGDEEIFRASGMDGYLSKPADQSQLMKVVEFHLNNTLSSILESLRRPIESYSEPIDQMKLEEIFKKVNQFRTALKQNKFIQLEGIAHQLKLLFEGLNAEELKNIAFKMELEIRKGRVENLESLLERIQQMIELLKMRG